VRAASSSTGGGNPDIVLAADLSIAAPFSLSAQRDIIVRASLATTGPSSNSLTLTAGTGAAGVGAGGVWVDHNGPFTGQLTSAGALTLTGKDLFATPVTSTDAVRLEGPVSAAGSLTLDTTSTGGAAPVGAGIYLGAIVQTSAGTLQANRPVTLTGTSVVTDTGSGTVTFADTINGAQALTLAASGTINLNAAVGGTTPLSSLTISNASDVNPPAAITAGTMSQQAGTGTSTFGGLLHASGVGGLSLSGTNFAISGGLTVDSGPASITASGTLPITTDPVNLNGQALTVANSGTGSISVPINGSGSTLTKSGTGTLTLNAFNTYTGLTTINAGTLSLVGGQALVDSGAVNAAGAGATLDLQNRETIGDLAGVTGTFVTLNANTLTTGDGTDTTFAGVLSGSGGLTKQGTDHFTLAGSNTYTGPTNLNNGTLTVAGVLNNSGVATGGVVQLNTAGVILSGVGTIKGQVTVAASNSGSRSEVQGVTITVPSGGTGISVLAGATFVQIGTTSGVTVNGGNATSTGVLIAGSARLFNSAINNHHIDVRVSGGLAAIQNTQMNTNFASSDTTLVTGLLVQNGGIVDAGQLATSATFLPGVRLAMWATMAILRASLVARHLVRRRTAAAATPSTATRWTPVSAPRSTRDHSSPRPSATRTAARLPSARWPTVSSSRSATAGRGRCWDAWM